MFSHTDTHTIPHKKKHKNPVQSNPNSVLSKPQLSNDYKYMSKYHATRVAFFKPSIKKKKTK